MDKRIYSAADLKVGDVINFLCNGRGRGGHYGVTAKVTKVNRMTVAATEQPRSYSPGMLWRVHVNHEYPVTRRA